MPGAIPESVFEKPPSAELRPYQKDSDSLPPYEVLDAILRLYVEGRCRSPADIAAELGVQLELVNDIARKAWTGTSTSVSRQRLGFACHVESVWDRTPVLPIAQRYSEG